MFSIIVFSFKSLLCLVEEDNLAKDNLFQSHLYDLTQPLLNDRFKLMFHKLDYH